MSRLGDAARRTSERERLLATAYASVAERHSDEPDVFHLCNRFGEQSDERAAQMLRLADGGGDAPAPRFEPSGVLLDDLDSLFVLTQECWIGATIVHQAAMAGRDEELLSAADACLEESAGQAKWLKTRIKTTAPQWLTVE
jgi:hypothetical protein